MQRPYEHVNITRYMLLSEYGGLYADLDVEALKPVDEIMEQHSCVMSQEPLIHADFVHNRDFVSSWITVFKLNFVASIQYQLV